MTESDQIIESLQPLFKQAREEKLLFRSVYDGTYFTPDELEYNQKHGTFVWGTDNWELQRPLDISNSLFAFERQAAAAALDFVKKMKSIGYL